MSIKYLEDILITKLSSEWYLLESEMIQKKYLFNILSGDIGRLPELNTVTKNQIIENVISKKKRNPKPISTSTDYLEKRKTPRLMLFLTSSCNLKCVYCHCNSGEENGDMEETLAITTIDKYLQHLDEVWRSPKKIEVTFMGGGEPLLKIQTIMNIVEYIKSKSIEGEYVIVTNGTIGKDKDWEWLILKNFRITISADGPPQIQDKQRKFRLTNKETSKRLNRTLELLNSNNKKINVRSTVMDVSSYGINSICKYFTKFPCVKTHHLEPVSFAGRGATLKNNIKDFHSNFFRNYSSYLYKDPERYKSAWFKPFKRSDGFCGAVYYNAVVTHDGNITLCSEVDSSALTTPYGKKYIVSHIDQREPFYSAQAKKFSEENVVDNLEDCKSCIVKYKCGGGCYIKKDRDFSNGSAFYDAYCKNVIILNLSYLIGTYENARGQDFA